MHLFIGQRLTSSLPCCSGACFSLPFAIPRTPATFGFCASGIGGLSKDPLRFKPGEKENKSKVSLSGRVRGYHSALNQNLGVACSKCQPEPGRAYCSYPKEHHVSLVHVRLTKTCSPTASCWTLQHLQSYAWLPMHMLHDNA